MAIKIQKPNETETYVPEQEDEDAPDRCEFYMTKLRAREKARIRDGMVGLDTKGRVNRFRQNQVSLNLVVEQLSGWNNVLDANGDQVEFNAKEPEKSFDQLPDEIQDELLDKFGSAGQTPDESEDEDAEEDVE